MPMERHSVLKWWFSDAWPQFVICRWTYLSGELGKKSVMAQVFGGFLESLFPLLFLGLFHVGFCLGGGGRGRQKKGMSIRALHSHHCIYDTML